MSKLLLSELRKIFGRRLFFGILASLLLCNVFFLWYANRESDGTPPLNAYHMLGEELSALPNQERPAFIADYYTDIKGVALVEKVKMYEAWQNEEGDRMAENIRRQSPATYERYLTVWKSGNYLRYTENLQQEIAFAEKIHTEMTQLTEYPKYLREIEAQAEALSGISIFSKEAGDGFSGRNIQKTAEDYASMDATAIRYDISYGVTAATSSLITDCLVFLFLFFVSFLMIYEEKNKGLFALVKAAPRGRTQTIAGKLAVLAVSTGGVVLLLYGSNLLFFHCTTGLGDLSRSIQSVGAFMGSTVQMSVGEFLLGFMAMKWLSCFLIGSMVALVSICLKKSTPAFLFCGAALMISFLLYRLIPANSHITILKHINVFGLFQVQDMLGRYLNLNIFGRTVPLLFAGLGAAILFTVLFSGLSVAVFTKGHDAQTAGLCLHLPVNGRKGKMAGKSVWGHELYKILWLHKSIVVLVGFIAVSVYGVAVSATYLPPQELYYQSYMKQLSGPITEEKMEFLENERTHFDTVQSSLAELEARVDSGELTERQAAAQREDLERELFKGQVFERVWSNYETAEAATGWLVYETGYHSLFDVQQTKNSGELLAVCLVLIVCCYNIFSMEYANGADALIRTTALGRSYTCRTKTMVAAGIMLAVAITAMLPALIDTANVYGLPALHAPAASLPAYAQLPAFLSIRAFLVIIYILKLLGCMAVAALVLMLSRFVRHSVYTFLLCALCLALPVILNVMGIDWCGYLSFAPLFDAGAFIARGQSALVAAYGAAAVLVIAVNAAGMKKRPL